MELTTMEYKKIARFYELPKPNNKSYKDIAEDMLAGKLCKCIKKVQSRRQIPEKAAIGLCRESIFKNRGIDFYKFNSYTSLFRWLAQQIRFHVFIRYFLLLFRFGI